MRSQGLRLTHPIQRVLLDDCMGGRELFGVDDCSGDGRDGAGPQGPRVELIIKG